MCVSILKYSSNAIKYICLSEDDHTNSASALIEVPYHVCSVIQHMQGALGGMSYLDTPV